MGSYRVKKGDSLYAIAKANNTTVANLYKLNPALASRKAAGKNVIFSNTLVKVPGSVKSPQTSRSSSTPKMSTTRKADSGTGRGRGESSSTSRTSTTRNSNKSNSPQRLSASTYRDVMNLADRLNLSRAEIAALNVAKKTSKKSAPKGRKKSLYEQQISDLMSAINNPVTR